MRPMSCVTKSCSILLLALYLWLAPAPLSGQIIEFDRTLRRGVKISADDPGMTFFNMAGVEAMTTAMQASTQLLRVDIGTKPIVIPLFFFVGAAGSAWGANGPKAAIANLLNPLSGNLNLRFADAKRVTPLGKENVLRLSYDLGVKHFTATDAAGEGDKITVGSAQAGFRFETRAVTSGNVGIAYLQVMAGGLQKWAGGDFQRLFGPGTKNRFGSLAADGGIDIKNILMAKFSFYQAIHSGTNAVLEKAIFKGGFAYHPPKS